ncbi:MAG: sodium:solute symporter [Hyphomicrobiaceae bacterium]
MPFSHRTLQVNARLGSYFGLFAATLVSLFAVLLVVEQIGVPERIVRLTMLVGPLVLFAAIGVASASGDVRLFFVAGRRVPAVSSGLVMAIAAVGSVGIVAFPGLMLINGIDAWCLSIGIASGFVVMAAMIAPFLRKLGAYTLAGYFGRRFESSVVRILMAVLLALPALLVIVAELRMGAAAAARLTGLAPPLMVATLAVSVLVVVLPGGLRGAGWSGTAQGIAVLLAVLVPMAMVGVILTNMPLAQLSYGPTLRAFGRLEHLEGLSVVQAGPLSFALAGQGLEALRTRMALPFVSLGPVSYTLTMLVVMAGIASSPWLLARSGTSPTVYHARKSVGWALLFICVLLTGLSASAVFLRDYVFSEMVGRPIDALPDWVRLLIQQQLASVDPQAVRLKLEAIRFARDGVLVGLPAAAGFATVFVYLGMAGAVAAALAALSASVLSLGASLSEDVLLGADREPPGALTRLIAARLAVAAVVAFASWLALVVDVDPLRLVLVALSLTAATAFPTLVLSIWWKRLTLQGALAGILVGFSTALAVLLVPDGLVLGLPRLIAGAPAVPLGFIAAVVVTKLTPLPRRSLLEVVRDMRVPGGEAVHDREVRLRRLKVR